MAYISIVVSTLALFVVSASLSYQAHQARVAQMIGARERHFELAKFTVEHPEMDYQKLLDNAEADEGLETGMSLWMSHWNTMWIPAKSEL